jgi:1-acyl-sn-glycerol-3-phosphate acyltransferase
MHAKLWIRLENIYFRIVFVFVTTLFLFLGYSFIYFVKKEDRSRTWHRIGRICLVIMFLFCFVRVKPTGLEHIPKKPCVIAMNHRSFMDTLSLILQLDKYFFVITEPFDALPHPLLQMWVSNLAYVPVIRDNKDKESYKIGMDKSYVVKECVDRIRKGETLVIYPEAHHEKNKGLLPFKTGAVRIALKAGVPLIPGAFTGTEHVISPYHHRMHPGTIHVRFGKPMQLDQFYGKQDDHALVTELTAQLRYEVHNLIERHRQ